MSDKKLITIRQAPGTELFCGRFYAIDEKHHQWYRLEMLADGVSYDWIPCQVTKEILQQELAKDIKHIEETLKRQQKMLDYLNSLF